MTRHVPILYKLSISPKYFHLKDSKFHNSFFNSLMKYAFTQFQYCKAQIKSKSSDVQIQ
jgi:hypothetical protein